MGAAKRHRKNKQRIRKLRRGIRYEIAAIEGSDLHRGLDYALSNPRHPQHNDVVKLMCKPTVEPGVLVWGCILKGHSNRKGSTHFVSFSKKVVMIDKYRHDTVNAADGKPVDYKFLDPQLIGPVITHALAKIAKIMSPNLQI